MYGAKDHYVIKSDRFLTNNIFKFKNAEGEEEILEEVDIDVDKQIDNAWINTASDNLMDIIGKKDKEKYIPMENSTTDR